MHDAEHDIAVANAAVPLHYCYCYAMVLQSPHCIMLLAMSRCGACHVTSWCQSGGDMAWIVATKLSTPQGGAKVLWGGGCGADIGEVSAIGV